MKTLRVEFKFRFIGEREPQKCIEDVDVEIDSDPEELDYQIKFYYYNVLIRPQSNIAETYPYTIVE